MLAPLPYDRDIEKDLRKSHTLIAKLYPLVPSGATVLDVGCHTGQFGALLKRKGRKISR